MNNELMKFEGNEVVVEIINGEPMFEIYSVGSALGYSRWSESKGKKYFKIEKSRINKILENADITGLAHGVQTFITEDQLYDFMLETRTEKCKAFRKWITVEVLPSIRKNGGYIANQENLTDEEILANAIILANNVIAEQKKKLELQQPKVEFAEKLLKVDEGILIREFAKQLCDKGMNIGEKRLFKWLRENKYLMSTNEPYQTYMNNNTFLVKSGVVDTPFGEKQTKTVLVTPQGQMYLYEKLKASDFVKEK